MNKAIQAGRAGLSGGMGRPEETKLLKNLLCFGIPILCLLITLLTLGTCYDTNDDATISNIASGAFGAQSERLIYVNILLGWLLKPLYLLCTGLNWYTLLQFAAVVLCLGIWNRLFTEKLGFWSGLIVGTLFTAAFGTDAFSTFQYVKNSGILLVTGLLLLALSLGKFGPRTIGGLLLALFGSMLRFENFYAVGALAAFLLLQRFFLLDKTAKKRAAITMAVLFALVFGAEAIDVLAYRTDPAWNEFLQYNTARTEISDYRIQFLQEEAPLKEMGLSDSDITMVKEWSFYDPQVFPTERLKEIAAALPSHTPFLQAVKNTLGAGFGFLFGSPVRILFAAVLLCCLLFTGKKSLPFFLGTMVMLGMLVFYLSYKGRMLGRIDFLLMSSAVLLGLFCCREARAVLPGVRTLLCAAALVLLCSLPYYQQRAQIMPVYRETHPYQLEEYEEMNADKDHLYVCDIFYWDQLQGYDLLHARPAGFFSNVVFTGGWVSHTPFQRETLQRYGAQSPFAALADKEEVYLISYTQSEKLLQYLREHYGEKLELQTVKQLDKFYLYRCIRQV